MSIYLGNQLIAGDNSSFANQDLSNITTVTNSLTSTAINPLVNKLTNADITVAPSADIDTGMLFKDVNDNNLAGFTTTRFTNGVQSIQMSALNKISGTEKAAYFNVYVDSLGNDIADGSVGVKSTIANWAMPKTNARTQLFTPSDNMNGVLFVASQTKNGYLYFTSTTSQNAHVVYLYNNSAGMETTSSAIGNYVIEAFIPVAKGQTCEFYYYDNNGGGGYTTYFIEASGG